MALGMVVGALLVPRLEHVVKLQLLFAGSVAGFGLAMLGFASVNYYWLAGIFAIIAGACIATVTVAGNSYVVRTTADELRGRVFTALESVIKVSLLLSMIVMAPLADFIGKLVQGFVESNGLAPGSRHARPARASRCRSARSSCWAPPSTPSRRSSGVRAKSRSASRSTPVARGGVRRCLIPSASICPSRASGSPS